MKSILILNHGKDNDFVDKLGKALKNNNTKITNYNILLLGENPDESKKAFEEFTFIVPILSSSSSSSHVFLKIIDKALEVERASGRTKILPIIYEKCVIPDSLMNEENEKIYADFTCGFEKGIEKLVKSTSIEIGKRTLQFKIESKEKQLIKITIDRKSLIQDIIDYIIFFMASLIFLYFTIRYVKYSFLLQVGISMIGISTISRFWGGNFVALFIVFLTPSILDAIMLIYKIRPRFNIYVILAVIGLIPLLYFTKFYLIIYFLLFVTIPFFCFIFPLLFIILFIISLSKFLIKNLTIKREINLLKSEIEDYTKELNILSDLYQ